jgi:Flp pilus assembly protein TadD
VEEPAALADYARALAADSMGAADAAAERYAAALAISPESPVLAAAAFRQAFAVGDKALALRAARALEKHGRLAPDGRLLLFSDSVGRKDWKSAAAGLDSLRDDPIFGNLAPLMQAWLNLGSGKGDPLAPIDGIRDNPMAAAYAAEHRPLLLLAAGRKKDGLAAIAAIEGETGPLPPRFAVGAAAQLARTGDRKAAIALLDGDAPARVAARERLQAGKPLRGSVGTAAQGIAELFLRFAADASAAEAPELALTLARMATFLAPENGPPWLVTAELLAARDHHDTALAALAKVHADDPLSSDAADLRLRILNASGRQALAVGEARKLAASQPKSVQSWARLGDMLSETAQHRDAAAAYAQALSLAAGGAVSAHPEWALWLLKGSALTQSGSWTEGKAALERAYKLAPEQAVVLNFLGYSQLERRENLAEAERLIREASKLQPDDAAITDSLGWALYVRGDLPQAIELLERAAQSQPADTAINEHLGDAYYSAGRRFEARYAWQAALIYAEGDAATRLTAKIDSGLRPALAAP